MSVLIPSTAKIRNNLAKVENKGKASRNAGCLSIKSTPKDAMKLRMTGFECYPFFVIRLWS